MDRSLDVWLHDRLAGTLGQTNNVMHFAYADAYLQAQGQPLSLSLRSATATGEHVANWFSNLLPEAEARTALAQSARLAVDDDFGLLAAAGRECAGAVSLWEPGQRPPAPAAVLEFEPLTLQQLEAWIAAPAGRPLGGSAPLRLSLAGAQHKAPILHFDDGTLALPAAGLASTHIVKIPNRQYPGLVTLEALGMRAAAAAGIATAHVQLLPTSSPTLLVRRYDRSHLDGVPRRLHQEDICQALGLPARRKYEADGGPSLVALFDVVRTNGADPARVLKLLDVVAVNMVLGNADAHGKNHSLLLHADGSADLVPAYDLVPTCLLDVSRELAMRLGGASSVDDLLPSHWGEFARAVRLRAAFVDSRVRELAGTLDQVFEPVAQQLVREGADERVLQRAVPVLRQRARAIAQGMPLPAPAALPTRPPAAAGWER